MRPEQKAPDNPGCIGASDDAAAASMRPEQKAPDNPAWAEGLVSVEDASMRPEQKAPDNKLDTLLANFTERRFNEAGAKSPG